MAMQQLPQQQPVQVPELLESYKQYVRANPAQVKRAEEMGRLGAMLLPVGRLGEYSELINELFYSTLGLVGAFHDHIIHGEGVAKLSCHRLRVMLNLLSHSEVVLEMGTRHFGGEAKHRQFVYSLECLKALVRLVILANTPKGSILMSGGQYDAKAHVLPVNTLQPQQQQQQNEQIPNAEQKAEPEQKTEEPLTPKNPRWVGKRSGKILKLGNALGEYDNTDANAAEQNQDKQESQSVTTSRVTRATARLIDTEADNMVRIFGEVLAILRPVVYIALVMRTTKKKWHPWILSMMIDVLSFRFSSVALAPQVAPETCNSVFECVVHKVIQGPGVLSTDADTKKAVAELGRRRLLVLFYLMRSPLYDNYTLAFIRSIRGGLEKLPVVGAIGGMIEETLQYYHKTHFYISAS
mmetsp:Transcript_13433/g.17422  ORF Transcript_13433/g.17422 Transcript_13433/m.17422 type:complete len:409 (+) Transcript_13433:159-1385(+)